MNSSLPPTLIEPRFWSLLCGNLSEQGFSILGPADLRFDYESYWGTRERNEPIGRAGPMLSSSDMANHRQLYKYVVWGLG